MAYIDPASAVAGQVATAAFFNTNVRDNIRALYTGASNITGQGLGSVVVGSTATQLKVLALGAAGFALKVNETGTDVEYGEVTSFLPSNAVRIAMGL